MQSSSSSSSYEDVRPDGSLKVFVSCAPGLDPFLARELEALGFAMSSLRPIAGTGFELHVPGGWRDVWRLNLWCGTASRVLVRLATFPVSRLPELRRKAGNVDWGAWLRPGTTCVVRAVCKKSKLYHSGAVAQRVSEALVDFGAVLVATDDASDVTLAASPGPDVEASDGPPVVPIAVRVEANVCEISLDTSGSPLDRRGWRKATAKAPLRADVARALVMASGLTQGADSGDSVGSDSVLVDPLCGAGTIAIEAAGWVRGAAPLRARPDEEFAFTQLPSLDPEAWRSIRAAAHGEAPSGGLPRVFASDRDSGGIQATRANAERAGLTDADLVIDRKALKEAAHTDLDRLAGRRCVVAANPPWGKRIGEGASLRNLYAALGASLSVGSARSGGLTEEAAPGIPWRLAIVIATQADPRLVGALGVDLGEAKFTTQNGGIRVRGFVSGR